ncbi:MAG TPA: SDR family oxidoreductase [Kofleriaceae bacterium]|jgi:3-oxoacyl-[acyl-carrier protein] reductase
MDDDVAVVSGGSRGLGKAIVESLLEAGYRVATFSRTETDFIRELRSGPMAERVWWQALDATDFDGLRELVKEVRRRFGQLDVLINNAGVAVEGVLPLMRHEEIHRVLAVNLEAAIVLAQACSRSMLAREQGIILNISSIIGSRGYSGLAAYSATKAGLDGLTRSLARELGPRGIRVNSIAPGYLETEMSSTLDPAQHKQIVRRTPLGRLGTVADVVGLVRFLLSPSAAFITGQTLVVDGGITC